MNATGRIAAFFLYFLLLALPGAAALADSDPHYPIGQVVAVEGKAYSFNGESRKIIKIDDPVFLNNVVETGAHSKLLILFIDDTQITLGENTELIIDEYIFDPYDAEENEGSFILSKGVFHWVSGLISKRKRPRVKIATEMGSIGIRGTEFWAGRIADGYGVYVNDGLVEFKGEWGTMELPSDTGVFVKPDRAFTPDLNYWNEINKMKAMAKVTFHNTGVLQQELKFRKRANIKKRHDYRGQMFPYKPNPYNPVLKPHHDNFFTDEFEQMRQDQ